MLALTKGMEGFWAFSTRHEPAGTALAPEESAGIDRSLRAHVGWYGFDPGGDRTSRDRPDRGAAALTRHESAGTALTRHESGFATKRVAFSMGSFFSK